MKVIFIKSSEHGKVDEVKDVADGLAKNLLIKKGFAIPATKENLSALKRKQSKIQEEYKLWEDNVNNIINAITEPIVVKRQSQDNDKIKGSLTSQDVSDLIFLNFGVKIDKKLLHFNKINKFGHHEVIIDFGMGKKTTLILVLIKG